MAWLPFQSLLVLWYTMCQCHPRGTLEDFSPFISSFIFERLWHFDCYAIQYLHEETSGGECAQLAKLLEDKRLRGLRSYRKSQQCRGEKTTSKRENWKNLNYMGNFVASAYYSFACLCVSGRKLFLYVLCFMCSAYMMAVNSSQHFSVLNSLSLQWNVY